MIRDSKKMKYNFFFCLDDADTKNKKMDANTENLKEHKKNKNNRRI